MPSWAICLVAISREAAAALSRGREPMEPACVMRNADNTKRRHQTAAIALPFTVPALGILFAPPSGCQRPTQSSREAAAALSRGREPMEPACMTRNADNTKRRHQPAAIALPFTVPAWGILFAPPSGCQRPTHSSREAAAARSRGREPMEPACTTRKARQQKAPTTESAYNRKRLQQKAPTSNGG